MHCYDIITELNLSPVLEQQMGFISEKKVSDDCQIAKSYCRNDLLGCYVSIVSQPCPSAQQNGSCSTAFALFSITSSPICLKTCWEEHPVEEPPRSYTFHCTISRGALFEDPKPCTVHQHQVNRVV